MDLNVKSIFFLTQALHGLLKAGASTEQPAKVINIASIDGLRLNTWETYSYQTSKAAVIQLTRRLAARLVKDGILVTGIAPGAFASDMNKAARDLGDTVGKHVPSGRIGNDDCACVSHRCLGSGSLRSLICHYSRLGSPRRATCPPIGTA
jgi:NAD(P)-dependent dehydrogenase (short-subunit alcohol dehydrogenase family)